MDLIPAQGGSIPALNANIGRNQSLFDELASRYASAGVISTPSYLMAAVPLTGPASNLRFNVLAVNAPVMPIERRLKQNDTFTVMAMSAMIALAAGATPADVALATMHTFPNANVAGFGANAPNFEGIYNAFLELRVDTTTIIDSLPMRSFYRVGQAQEGVGATTPYVRDEWPEVLFGRNQLTPSIELNGQATIEFNIQLCDAVDFTPAAGNAWLLLMLTGFLNQGASAVQRKFQEEMRRINQVRR